MQKRVFLFDLDGTITKEEILPKLAIEVGCYETIRALTEQNMQGKLPFKTSFLQRVEILKELPVSRAREIVEQIPLHEEVVTFIQENAECCRILTGNLDVWVEGLLERIGMAHRYESSQALVEGDRVVAVTQVIEKRRAAQDYLPHAVAIGDGDDDAALIGAAEIGIGFGAVRPIAVSVLENADYAVYSEEKLCQFLKRL